MNKMKVSPAASRNLSPILQTLKQFVSVETTGRALEIASGSGQHVIEFSKMFPSLVWQPSENDSACIDSIQEYIQVNGVSNILPPVLLDVQKPYEQWNISPGIQLLVNINMTHISPFAATLGLLQGSEKMLIDGGFLCMYGPFQVHGVVSPQSNIDFDQMLRQQCSEWGLREIDDIIKLAKENQLHLIQRVDMPKNNHMIVFQKRQPSH